MFYFQLMIVHAHGRRFVDYVVIGFDMEVQPFVTHNAALPLCSVVAYGASAVCISVANSH